MKIKLFILAILIYGSAEAQQWLWTKNGGGPLDDLATDLIIDEADNFYAVGNFSNSVTFDGQTVNLAGDNSFIIKYNAAGTKRWLFAVPGKLKKITIDPNNANNLVVAGTFSGTINIGSTPLLVSNGLIDCYAIRIDSSGNIIWSTSWGGTENDDVHDAEYQSSGKLMVTGNFLSPLLSFKDGITLTEEYPYSLTSINHAANLYVAQLLNSNGKVSSAKKGGLSLVVGAANENLKYRLEADLRAQLGLTVLKDDASNPFVGSTSQPPIKVGDSVLQFTYLVLQLDTNFRVKKRMAAEKRYLDAFDDIRPQFGNSHLDRSGEYFLDISKNDIDVGGIGVGIRYHIESVSGKNIYSEVNHPGIYQSGQGEFPPLYVPFGLYNNNVLMRYGTELTINPNFAIRGSGLDIPHTSNFLASTHLFNNNDKIFIAGKNTTGPFGASDAYLTVLQIPSQVLKADAGIDKYICSGTTEVTLGGSPSASGGSSGPYLYSWQPAAGLNNTNIPYPIANPAVTTTYTLTVTDGSGQTATDNVTVLVNQQVVPTITASGPLTICQGAFVNLTSSVGISYLWSNGQTTQSITASIAGTYTVTVTNECGGTLTSAPVTVTVNPNPPLFPTITASGPTTFCNGGSVTLTAPAGYTYLWNNGATTQSISATTSNFYSVSIFNSFGCSSPSFATQVTVHPNTTDPLSITANGPITFCSGNSVYLSAPSGAFNFPVPFSYLWSTGSTQNGITVTTTGSYSVTLTSLFGCGPPTTLAPVIINVIPAPPPPVITASGPTTFCNPGQVTLTGPPGYASYRWIRYNINDTVGTNQSILVDSTVRLTLQIKDNNGCPSYASRNVFENDPLTGPITITPPGPLVTCDNSGVSFNLSAPAGPGFTYLWNTGSTQPFIVANTTGNYSVAVSNGCNTLTSAPVSVTVNPAPPAVINASGPLNICSGGSVTLSAPVGAGYTYQWLLNSAPFSTSQSINATSAGTYQVTITSANNCISSAQVVVTVSVSPPVPLISSIGSTTFCQGGSVTLIAPSGYSYQWSNGATTQSITVNTAGNYSVTVTNSNGCSATSLPKTVTVNPLPPVPVITTSGPTTFCQGGSVTLSAPAGYNYVWSNISLLQSINVTSNGNYSVTITDPNSCSSTSAPITVTVNPLPPVPVITVSGPTSFCQGGSVTLTAPAGFNYLWSNGATTQSINVNTSGNYNVRVTNANNCSSFSANTIVTVTPLPAVPVITQNGNVLTSTAASTYQWFFNGAIIPGATAQSYTYSTGGDYTVTVTNAQGCSSTSQIYTAMRNEFVLLNGSERFFMNLFPNPVTSGQLTIVYELEQPHKVAIRLINAQGRSIPVQSEVNRTAGRYSVNANAVAERIWPGVYILEFRIDGKKVTRMIVKL